MSAMTSEDLARPATDVTPSRRIKTPEQLCAEIAQLDESPYVLSAAGKQARHELQEQLNEQLAVTAVDRQAVLQQLKLGEQIEAKANEAIAALETYCDAREQLLALREPYDKAYRQARDLGLEIGPRVRTAAPVKLQRRAAVVARWGWYI